MAQFGVESGKLKISQILRGKGLEVFFYYDAGGFSLGFVFGIKARIATSVEILFI